MSTAAPPDEVTHMLEGSTRTEAALLFISPARLRPISQPATRPSVCIRQATQSTCQTASKLPGHTYKKAPTPSRHLHLRSPSTLWFKVDHCFSVSNSLSGCL